MPTRSSSSIAPARAARLENPRCSLSGSAICDAIGWTGSRLVIGFWKTIAMSRPRIAQSARLVEREQVAPGEGEARRRDASPAATAGGA